MKVEIYYSIRDKGFRKKLWEIYSRSFTHDLSAYPHNQVNYDYEKFQGALVDKGVIKFVGLENNKPVGLAIVVNNQHPQHSPWTNFLAFITKGKVKAENFYYINVLTVDPDYQVMGIGVTIVDNIIVRLLEMGAELVGFDAPQEKTHLIKLVNLCCEKRGCKLDLIGAQNYYSVSRKQ